MLKRASVLWAAALFLLGIVTFMDNIVPRDTFGDIVPELVLLHSILVNTFKFLTGVLIFSLVDMLLLPDLDIGNILKGEGHWGKTGEDYVRAAAILTWGLIFSIVLYSFMVVT